MRKIITLLIVAVIALAITVNVSAEGGKVRGEKGQGFVHQVVGP